MKHTAQDVLNAANKQSFRYPFSISDAQKVLDASPAPIKIAQCIFAWNDINGLLTIDEAQDVLNSAIQQNSPHTFSISDAQIVLDASPARVNFGNCYFIWDDVGRILIISTAQNVLDKANEQDFPFPISIDDAQKVLDASPARVKIRKCYFTWHDVGRVLNINCPEELEYDLRHPADPRAPKRPKMR